MARNRKLSRSEKREKEQEEKAARRSERVQSRRGKSSSFQRRLKRDEEKEQKRDLKEERFQERVESGDQFAISEAKSRKRKAKSAEKIGRKRAALKFRTEGTRSKDAEGVITEEVAKAGNTLSGKDGGRRAVSALEDKRDAADLKANEEQEAKKVKKTEDKSRFKKAKRLRKKAFDKDYKEQLDFYNRNPAEVQGDSEEGFFDLVEEFGNLKDKKTRPTQFTNALEELRGRFNQSGGLEILELEEKNGNLHIVTDGDDIIYNPAKQKAIREVGGKSRRDALKLEESRAEETRRSALGLDVSQKRAEITGAVQDEFAQGREQRGEERQVRSEGRSKVERSAQQSRATELAETKGGIKAKATQTKAVSDARTKEFDFKRKRLDTAIGTLEKKKKLSTAEKATLEKYYGYRDQYDKLATSRLK